MDQIFRAFANVVYFLKFIDEHHDELGDIYEKVLQEFFGLFGDPTAKQGSNQNLLCMFDEFIKASLSLRSLHPKNEVDFRIILINIMIRNITTALQFQMNDSEMMHHMFQDSSRFSMWPKLLEKGLEKDKERKNYPRRLYRYT